MICLKFDYLRQQWTNKLRRLNDITLNITIFSFYYYIVFCGSPCITQFLLSFVSFSSQGSDLFTYGLYHLTIFFDVFICDLSASITYKMKHLIFGCIEISLATDDSFLHNVWIFVLPIVFIVLMHCHGQNVTKVTLPSAFIMQKIGKFLLFYLKANQHQIYRKIKVRWYESIAKILVTYEEKQWNRSQNWMIHSLLQSTIVPVLVGRHLCLMFQT